MAGLARVGVACVLALLAVGCGTDERASVDSNAGVPTTPARGAGSVVATTVPSTTKPPAPTSPPTATPPGPTTTVPDPVTGDAPMFDLQGIGHFDMPTDVAGRPGDDAIYVSERGGRVKALAPGAGSPTTVLDLTADTSIDSFYEGLLGFTFSPDGATMFVHYSDKRHDSVVAAFDMGADGRADPGSRRELLRVARPSEQHHGGDLHFGPDGYLYVALGDGAQRPSHALDLDSLDGKLLRLDPKATDAASAAAPDGPFVDRGGRPEIWAIGLRNPWRFSFDRQTGDLWIADVGEERFEEIDMAPAASHDGRGWNYGWSAFEGTEKFGDHPALGDERTPVYEYAHGDDTGCSINGGFVYRGVNIPALDGWYLFSDYCTSTLRALRIGADGRPEVRPVPTDLTEIVTFGEDDDGELLVAVLGGEVYRLVPA